MVRGEVIEYLEEFAEPSDAPQLLRRLEAKDHVFGASQALRRICTDGPILDDDDDEAILEGGINVWRSLLASGTGNV